MSDVGNFLGFGSDPGVLGSGKYKYEGYDINKDAFSANGTENETTQLALDRAKNSTQGTPVTSAAKIEGPVNANVVNANAANLNQAAQAGRADQIGAEHAFGSAVDTSQSNQARQAQTGLVSQLQEQAAGRGPSLATQQLKAGNQQNLANSLAMAASQRGTGGSALAARQVQQQQANAGAALAAQSAQARTQEQLNAQGQLAGLSSNIRSQDIGSAQAQAQLLQQATLANQGANLTAAQANQGANLQNAQFNATQQNANDAARAQLQQQVALANAQAGTQVNLANAGAGNQVNATNAGFQQAANLQSSLMAQKTQENNAANQLANLQLATQQGQFQQTQQEALENLQVQQNENKNEVQSGAFTSAANHNPVQAIISDENAKVVLDEPKKEAPTGDTGLGLGSLSQMFEQALNQKSYGLLGNEEPGSSSATPIQPLQLQHDPNAAMAGAAGTDKGSHLFSLQTFSNLSDEHAKKLVGEQKIDDDMQDFMEKAAAHRYVYKDPRAPGAQPGEQYGPMAQALERSAAGSTAVKQDPTSGYKMVDGGRLSLVNTAALHSLNERVEQLEGKSKKRRVA